MERTHVGQEIGRILDELAFDAGIPSAQMLAQAAGSLRKYRYTALAIIAYNVVGVDRRRLAATFRLEPDSLTVMIAQFHRWMEGDPEFRLWVARMCVLLGLEVPVRPKDRVFPQQRVREIWAAVAQVRGLSPEALYDRRRSVTVAPWIWLALDLCLRMCGVSQGDLMAEFGLTRSPFQSSQRQLGFRLNTCPDMKDFEKTLCRRFGLPANGPMSAQE